MRCCYSLAVVLASFGAAVRSTGARAVRYAPRVPNGISGASLTVLAVLAAVTACIATSAGRAEAQPRRLGLDSYRGQVPPSTEPPTVELITFERGVVIFEKFGHAALCLRYQPGDTAVDPRLQHVCFNYGVTDFGNPKGLVWGFLRGTQRFWVEPAAWESTFAFYQWEDRTVWRQVLPTTPEQARAMEAALWGGLAEDKKYYEYDHFFDNCTTRLRDFIDVTFDHKLSADNQHRGPRTFRELGREGLAEFASIMIASDFFVGRELERYPTRYEEMFLPMVLRDEVTAKLGVKPELLYARRGPPIPNTGPNGRLPMMLGALAAALLLLAALWTRRWTTGALWLSLAPVVLLGLAIWVVVGLTKIDVLRYNEVALLYWPSDAYVLFASWTRKVQYARLRLGGIAVVVGLHLVGVFQQPLWMPLVVAALPFAVLALAGRSGALSQLGRRKGDKVVLPRRGSRTTGRFPSL